MIFNPPDLPYWCLKWALGWIGFWLLGKLHIASYTRRWMITVLYFLVVIEILLLVSGYPQVHRIMSTLTWWVTVMLLYVIGVWVIAHVKTYPHLLTRMRVRVGEIAALSGEKAYLRTKLMEIMYQQILVRELIVIITARGLPLISSALLTGLVFVIGHLPLLVYMRSRTGLFFTIGSGLYGIVAYLLMQRAGGSIAILLIHWAFYLSFPLIVVITGRQAKRRLQRSSASSAK